MPPPTHFTFYLYLKDGSIRRATRRWKCSLREAHLMVLRKAMKNGSEVLRLETCYMDHLGKLRAMVSDYRT